MFGSKHTEEELRRAANLDNSSRQSFSSNTGSSAYDTAPEYYDDDSEEYAEHNGQEEIEKVKGSQVVRDDETIRRPPSVKEARPNSYDEVEPNVEDNEYDNDSTDIFETSKVHDTPARELQDAGEVQDFNGNVNEFDEDNLNRAYTIARVASHKSVQEVGESEMYRSITAHSKPKQLDSDKDEDHNGEHEHLSLNSSTNHIEVADLDWDGPDDKGNPHIWPAWKKWWITITVAVVCLCCSLGSSLYTGGITDIVVEFGVSTELALVGLTLYMVGLALGPLLAGPLSEKIGRRWIYIISFPIGMLFNLGIGFAKNIETVLVLRFFVGFFGSPALSVASGTISDLWSNKPEALSFAIALFCLGPFLGPVIGPIVGGFTGEYKGWKWPASWVYLMFSGAALLSLVFVPETYKTIILQRRAKKRGINVIHPEFELKAVAKFVFLKPVLMLLAEPIVSLMSIYVAFIFAVLFGFFEAFPVIFRGVYHMDLGISGLPFISVGLGLVAGVVLYVILDKVKFFPKNADGTRGNFDENGNIIWGAPEEKLLVGKIGAVCLPISLFWLGWTGRNPDIHWMAPTAAGFPFGLGLILVFFSVVGYFSMAFPPINVASAMSANNVLRYTLASVFPLFTIQMYENLGIGWASSVFGFIALLLLPVPFVFAKIGPGLRAKSKYGYAAYFKELAMKKAQAEKLAVEKTAVNEEVASNTV